MAGYIGARASVVSSGAERKQTYAITTTTTSLTGLAYTPTKVHVFHNGIRLVDGTDYTATNGTSITLTNAAQDGDEVVVISYATFQTSDTVSAANGGTFAGNVEHTGTLTASSDLNAGTIKDATGTNTAMTINSDGVVTKGVLPAWRVSLSPAVTFTTSGGSGSPVLWNVTSGDNCFIQGGCSLDTSTGQMTVPVSGVYLVNFNTRYDSVGSGYIITRIERNSSSSGSSETYVIDGSPDSSYLTLSGSECYHLDANDTLRITVMASADTSWDIQDVSTFSGALIG